MLDKIKELENRRLHLSEGGGSKAIERQHQMTKLTARERLQRLFDGGTFQELNLWARPVRTGFDIDDQELPGDAVVTGFGEVNGRPVYAYAHDFTVMGGTFGSATSHKVTRVMEMALEARVPYIGIVDSGGERIHDLFGRPGFRPVLAGRLGIGGSSCIYAAPALCSGVIPQITVMLGPSYAGSAYSPTMADFYIMRKGTAFMSVASPQLLKAVTFAEVTQEQIGGAELHATVTGIADFLAETDDKAIEICRELVTYIPLNNERTPSVVSTGDDPNRRDTRLREIVPADLSAPYDMHEVIRSIVDSGHFFELQELFAGSIIIGFARLDGQTVGIVANNPAQNNGLLTLDTCDKQARFIRWCDAFNVPLVFLIDTAGFASSAEEEQSGDGLLRTAVKPLFAISEASVPMVAVHIGRCFGMSRLVMGTLRMGVDVAYSWPSAQVVRMEPDEIVDTVYRKEIASSKEPDKVRKEKLSELLQKYVHYPYHAAEQLMVSDIIDPQDTRPVIIRTLKNLADKKPGPRPWRKHSLIPR